ncbi:DNA translocase FtsK [Alteribacter aurantiacus]|uniref:DNA translocase FtsK n=1 Tax=Alteribacter aurantiacus TaxID=254410 RepID=UPI0003F99C07|nr:DNA translocase FtsK [Alteribacter aurantiacus]
MKKNFKKWIDDMKGFFSGDEEGEFIEKPVEPSHEGKNAKPNFKKNTTLPLNKSDEPKIIHQYPKTGAFRFPVVKDEEPLGKDVHMDATYTPKPKGDKENESQKPKVDRKRHRDWKPVEPMQEKKPAFEKKETVTKSTVSEQEKVKFGGRDFSVRQIPSPIFGFGKREEEKLQKYREDVLNEFLRLEGIEPKGSREDKIEAVEELDEDVISRVLTESEHRDLMDMDKEEQEQQEQQEEQEERESEQHVVAKEVPMPAYETTEDVQRPVFEKEPEVEEPEQEMAPFYEEVEKHEATEEESSHSYEKHDEEWHEDLQVEDEPDGATDDELFNDEEDISSVSPAINHAEVEEVTDNESVKQMEKEDGQREVAASLEAPDAIKKEEQQPKDEKRKEKPARQENKPSSVPFNVLMFQRDRVKQERKEKENRGKGALPELHLLEVPPKRSEEDDQALTEQSALLNQTLEYFNVRAKVVNVTRGPSVTRFEVQPEPGVKVSKITNLQDDIKLSLAAKDIRMEAPIPGKNTIGIEVPNRKSDPVFLRDILKSRSYIQSESPLTAALGVDIGGQPVVTDLQKMPHGLIAGATGSGKSVCMNAILLSLLYKASPKDVRLLLIDPKMVELAPYNGLPHLAAPVITDAKEATQALKWAVEEMDKRYERFAETGSRDLARYNKKMREQGKEDQVFPYLVIVVDELADLMMVSPQEVEDAICRIAQKARACGIHLLVATQRPSVDVITGLIKANIPTRIAFSVSAQTDSRTILDASGAEKLLGRGDMLFLGNGESKSIRLQGAFVSDDEIERVTEHVKKTGTPRFLFEREELQAQEAMEADDPMFEEVCRFIIDQQAASSSLLQRRFRMGFNRAARLIDMLEERGIISPAKGSKPRDVYLTHEDLEEKFVEKG